MLMHGALRAPFRMSGSMEPQLFHSLLKVSVGLVHGSAQPAADLTMRILEERLLHILRDMALLEIRLDQPDLTMRQLAILLVVYRTSEPQTVRGMAAHLSISKPSVTRALDRLGKSDLTLRRADPRGLRSVIVGRTAAGDAMVQRLKDALAEAAFRWAKVPVS